LLNTAADLRAVLQRGSTIFINEVPYETSLAGEWGASCVQLAVDYAGETNFSVTIRVPNSSQSPKKKKGAGAGKPDDANISQTVKDLDSINEIFTAKLKLQQAAEGTNGTKKRAGGGQRIWR
jgi:hypothetical protein